MTTRVAINGFGRMGRLALRAAWDWKDDNGQPLVEFVHINENACDAITSAHLLTFDSTHGRWQHEASADSDSIVIGEQRIGYSQNTALDGTDWAALNVDMVIECSGTFRTEESLQPYFDQGIDTVLVSAPVKGDALNIVYGVNDHLYDPGKHKLVTAASCTTNCLAPVVKVIHEKLGINHGSMTTLHNITNTQRVLDLAHKDLRRARASGASLIPTTTGSAKAITQIFPELKGKLNGHAVRVPLANASLTDCVFEVSRATTAEEVNGLLKEASETYLKDILGYETRPLVSIDYVNDSRSSIIDAPSTLVINDTQVKIYAWYDNEVGYVNRMMELAVKIGQLKKT